MDNKELLDALNRIADALESIYRHLENNQSDNVLYNNAIATSEQLLNVEEDNSVKKEDEHDIICNFLKTKGLQLNKLPEKSSADSIFDRIASFIGDNYNYIRPLLDRIKNNMANGTRFTISIKNESQKAISSMCQLATLLYENALLEEYIYKKSPVYLISAKSSTDGKIMNFFSGNWLERYVCTEIESTLENISSLVNGLEYHVFNNIQIVLPNGNFFELDVLVFVNDRVYWFECKSGNYQQHINKYSNFAKKYNFNYEDSFLVLSEIDENTSNSLCSLYNIKSISITILKNTFQQKLLEQFGLESF